MSNFWENKRVLVTGADGFIGSHLTETLVRQGASVRAFVLYNSLGERGWLETSDTDVINHIEFFPGDIRDSNRVREAVEGIDIVFHLASLIAIPYSYHAPDSYIQTNIGGALNILNACRSVGVDHLLHTSTSEVYGTAQYVPIDESHPLQGQSPYSASKIGADMLAESYYRSFDVPVSIVRPFNTYGPRQSARAVIPAIFTQLHSGVDQIKLGSLHPKRDFNFVLDTVSGFLAAAQNKTTVGRVVNVGSGREVTIEELVSLIIKVTGKNTDIVCDVERMRPEKSEVDRLLADISLAKETMDWKPYYTLEEGLVITSEWISKNLSRYQLNNYVL